MADVVSIGGTDMLREGTKERTKTNVSCTNTRKETKTKAEKPGVKCWAYMEWVVKRGGLIGRMLFYDIPVMCGKARREDELVVLTECLSSACFVRVCVGQGQSLSMLILTASSSPHAIVSIVAVGVVRLTSATCVVVVARVVAQRLVPAMFTASALVVRA